MEDGPLIEWAAAEAERLLAPLGLRWAHSQAVAAVARQVGRVEGVDGKVLVAAAYLHDVGYAPALHVTGHHGIDGGKYLQGTGQTRLAALVAHHSASDVEAAARGLRRELAAFPPELTPTADALTFCDMVTDAAGSQVSLERRVEEVAARYGEAHLVARALHESLPELERAVGEIQARLSAAGINVYAITG